MATTYTFSNLPKPPSGAHNWTSVYQSYVSKNDPNGYLTWLWNNQRNAVIKQGFQFPASFTSGSTTGSTLPPGTATTAAGGAGAVPIPPPQNIVMPALDAANRFGTYHADPYVLGQSYAGPESPPPFAGTGGAPGATLPPAGAPGAAPTPTPSAPSPSATGGMLGGQAPAPAPTPTTSTGGGGGNWNGGSGQYSGGMLGGLGGSGLGSGTTAASAQGGSTFGSTPGLIDIGAAGSGLLDIGSLGAGLLGMAGHMPGIPGLIAGGLNLAGRAYNTSQVDNIREQQGMPALSIMQALSGLTGIGGDYGSLAGDTTIANPEQFTNRLNPGLQALERTGLYSRLNPQYAETADGTPYNSFNIGPFRLGTTTPAFSYGDASGTLRMLDSLKDPSQSALNPATGMPGWMTATDWTDLYGPDSYAPPKPATGTTAPASTGTYTPATAPSSPTVTGATTLAAPPKYTATVAPSTTSTPSYSSIGLTPVYDRGILAGYRTANGSMLDTATATRQLQAATGSLTGTSSGSATTAAMGGGWNGGTSSGGGIGSGTGTTGGGQGERAGFFRGGMIPGRPDGVRDNVPANVDQGEFVIQRSAAKALGRGMLAALNDPKKARRMRGMLRHVG